MNIRTRRNNIQKTLKDYLVPIIALFLIIVLIYSFLSSDDKQNNISNNPLENTSGANIEFVGDDSEVYIEYASGEKKLIENGAELYKGEKVIVKQGSIKINFPTLASAALDKMGSLEYKEDGELYLDSSNLWLEAKSPLSVNMSYGKVDLSDGSIVNLNQNEAMSTVYNISGIVEVSNLAGAKTTLGKGQKVSILVGEASNDELDMSSMKEELDDYFKASDWFIKNGGDFYLNAKDDEDSSTGSLDLNLSEDISSLLSFDNLSDESQASSDTIDITGKYNSAKIGKITLNQSSAKLDEENKNFEFKSVSLNDSVNDLVFKIYDKDENIIKKIVYTIYRGKSKDSGVSSSGFKVTNFKLDASKFVFTAPSTSGTYSTFEDRVTIKGAVPEGVVSYVTVNDYKLGSFNGKTWRYHAWTTYDNLKEGTNLYQVKYFDSNGKMIYTNYYTIIKKSAKTNTKTYSKEATPN